MQFPQHFKAGLIASAAVTISARTVQGIDKLEQLLLIFGLCLAGSLAPDLDTKSVPHKITALFGCLFCIGSIAAKQPYPALYFSSGFLLISASNHRGLTHSFFWPVAFIAGYAYLNIAPTGDRLEAYYLFAFGIGLLTHYILDRMNPLKLQNWVKI